MVSAATSSRFIRPPEKKPTEKKTLDAEFQAITTAFKALSTEQAAVMRKFLRLEITHVEKDLGQWRKSLHKIQDSIIELRAQMETLGSNIPHIIDTKKHKVVGLVNQFQQRERKIKLLEQQCNDLLILLNERNFRYAVDIYSSNRNECLKIVESKTTTVKKIEDLQKHTEELRKKIDPQRKKLEMPPNDLPETVQKAMRSFHLTVILMLQKTLQTVLRTPLSTNEQVTCGVAIQQIGGFIHTSLEHMMPVKTSPAALLVPPLVPPLVTPFASSTDLEGVLYFKASDYMSKRTFSYWFGSNAEASRIKEKELTQIAGQCKTLIDTLKELLKKPLTPDEVAELGTYTHHITYLQEQITGLIDSVLNSEFSALIGPVHAYAHALLGTLDQQLRIVNLIIEQQCPALVDAQQACTTYFAPHESAQDELTALFKAFSALDQVHSTSSSYTILAETLALKSQAILRETKDDRALIDQILEKQINDTNISAIETVLVKRALKQLFIKDIDDELELCLNNLRKQNFTSIWSGEILGAYVNKMAPKRLEENLLNDACALILPQLSRDIIIYETAKTLKKLETFKGTATTKPDTLASMVAFLDQRCRRQGRQISPEVVDHLDQLLPLMANLTLQDPVESVA